MPCLAKSALLAVTKDLPAPSAAQRRRARPPPRRRSVPRKDQCPRPWPEPRNRRTRRNEQVNSPVLGLWDAKPPDHDLPASPARQRLGLPSSSLMTATPTVPRPAIPTRKGDGMDAKPVSRRSRCKMIKTARGFSADFRGSIKHRATAWHYRACATAILLGAAIA